MLSSDHWQIIQNTWQEEEQVEKAILDKQVHFKYGCSAFFLKTDDGVSLLIARHIKFSEFRRVKSRFKNVNSLGLCKIGWNEERVAVKKHSRLSIKT